MYQVYQSGRNASVTLSLLSLSLERKMKCYNEYFISMCFILKNIDIAGRHIAVGVCVKGSTFNEFEVDYYRKLK